MAEQSPPSTSETARTTEEIADVVRFLASPAASFITGQSIVAKGIPLTPD